MGLLPAKGGSLKQVAKCNLMVVWESVRKMEVQCNFFCRFLRFCDLPFIIFYYICTHEQNKQQKIA